MMLALALAFADPSAPPLPRVELPAEISRCASDRSAETLLCRALAAGQEERFADSAELFEQAARALGQADGRRERAWVAAGNMWLAAEQPARAGVAIDHGLAGTGLDDHQRGEALVDRARAALAAGDTTLALARLDSAAALVADDPYLWFTRGAALLARRDFAGARTALARGLTLAPDSADLLLASAEVEAAAGNPDDARRLAERAAAAEPGSRAARNAAALLQLNLQSPPATSPAP